jgi:hypothetical protein
MEAEGYRVGKQLHASAHSVVHEGLRESDGSAVVLKYYPDDRLTDTNPRARRELEMLRRVAGKGIPRAIDLDCTSERPLLVMERLPGLPLARILDDGPLDLESWLLVGVQAAEALSRIHAARVLHRDLTPSNLLVDRTGGRTWICDFGLAQELGAAERTGEAPASGLETLLYVSPEQTGRMNRGCDFRSDLYSLGATLYHALTGHPPFSGGDALYLVHAHLARIPAAPLTRRPEIPATLSRLLLKLLSKEPQERYQSARVLLADLIACRDQLSRSGAIADDFPLGSAEARECPRFAVRLYGREAEVELLANLYREAASGRTRTLWIAGEPGAGKSALADQLRPLLAQNSGYLAIGKFDLYGERPYAGWISALASLAQQILVESDARLERWRSELRTALGPIAHALIDLVPDLAFVLGDVAPGARLDPREAQARLSLALQRFVSACATTDHPLVLFLDDLQWSDAASRTLLRDLVANPSQALFVIGAHRLRHQSPGLDALLADLRADPAAVFLRIEELSRDAVAEMLADALGRSRSEILDLVELVERRAGTSPLLVRHFIEHIHARGLLRYEEGRGWTWDPTEIRTVELPDGALALLAGRIDRLPPQARAVLQFASCVGDEFDVELLCELGGIERATTWEALCTLAEASLISPCASGFRFAHDRIRESAQERLSAEERAGIHLGTARLLLERVDPAQSQRAPEIVEHLKRVPEIPEEIRMPAMRASCTAGNLALRVGAADSASEAFALARGLLRDQDRQSHASVVLELYLQSAETAYQLGEFEAALGMLDLIDVSGLSVLDTARLEGKRIQILAMCRDAESCVKYALAVLRRLGVRWPLHPSRIRAKLELALVAWKLRKRSHPDFFPPAKSFHPRTIAVLLVVRAAAGLFSRVDVHLAVLATCLSMRLQGRYGYFAPPAFGIAVYAGYRYLFLGQRRACERLAETARVWTERMPDPTAARTHVMLDVVMRPFLMRRREALTRVEHIVESARENGDLEYAYYARFIVACYLALAGDEVRATSKGLASIAGSVRGSLQWHAETERVARVYGLLDTRDISTVDVERAFHDDISRPELAGLGQGFSGTLWLLVLCTFELHDLAFAQSQRLWKGLFLISPFVHVLDHLFYRGIAAASLADSRRGVERRRYLSVVRSSLRYIRGRARDGPDFAHMVLLLEAEQARLTGNVGRARSLYDEGATRAARQAFPHHAALAHERHARLLVAMRRETEAAELLRRAIATYREWGALGKAELLRENRSAAS